MSKTVKNLKWINNGTKNKRISLDQLDSYLSQGWKIGQLPTTSGYIWVNKDGKNTTINKAKLSEYLANGWSKGKILSENEINNVKVHKDGKTKLIPKEQLDDYLSQGWIRGIHQKYRWITNDIVERWTDIELPEGWKEGRLYKEPDKIISVYNEHEVIQIKHVELHTYEKLGYKVGKGMNFGLYEGATKNTTWMNDGVNTVCVKNQYIDEYLANGFVKGNLYAQNRISVNKNGITKYIKLSDLDDYIINGYSIGNASAGSMTNRRWVQKDGKYITIPITEYDQYIKNGWKPGRPIRASAGKIWIHKENKRTYIDPNELQTYLDQGWRSGKIDAKFYITNGTEDKLVSWDEYESTYKNSSKWKIGTTSKLSIVEAKFKQILDDNNITDYESHFYLNYNGKKYYYDFKIGNILIELNPYATHNCTWSPYGTPLTENYHFNKSQAAINSNYRCICIWDWDSIDILLQLLKKRKSIYARQCSIRNVSVEEATQFLDSYHFQGYARDSIRLGLYYNDELVSILTFGKPRYNKQYEYELIRYCSKYNITGGIEKLFSYFTNIYNPKSIISYCDLSKFSGDIYEKLGFVYKSYSIGKHWYNSKHNTHITDNLLRQQGFDRLLGNIFGTYGKGTSNEELMLEHSFVEIYDCGQAVYVKNF